MSILTQVKSLLNQCFLILVLEFEKKTNGIFTSANVFNKRLFSTTIYLMIDDSSSNYIPSKEDIPSLINSRFLVK